MLDVNLYAPKLIKTTPNKYNIITIILDKGLDCDCLGTTLKFSKVACTSIFSFTMLFLLFLDHPFKMTIVINFNRHWISINDLPIDMPLMYPCYLNKHTFP